MRLSIDRHFAADSQTSAQERNRAQHTVAAVEAFLQSSGLENVYPVRYRRLTPERVQRLILLQLLRTDHPVRWCRAELETELPDVEPLAVCEALHHLQTQHVVCVDGERVRATTCAWHLNHLNLIAA